MDFIIFGTLVIIKALMDVLDFYWPHDNGYFSLHTGPHKLDAWHTLGVLFFTIIAIRLFGMNFRDLCIAGIINLIFHNLIMYLVKPKKE